MSVTQSNLDELDQMIADGVTERRFQDRMERYDSAADMLIRRAFLYSQLHPSGTVPGIRRRIQIVTSSGF